MQISVNKKAMKTMEPEIISRETIKPSSPTPPYHRIHCLSLFDELSPRLYVPFVYFYPNQGSDTPSFITDKANQLKNSLSKTLSRYYPFAGRVKDRLSIDCNDEGVVFLEARIKCMLSEILENPKAEALNLLFADDLQWKDSNLSSLLAIQISYFDCGGMAIGVCISHKIGDAATMVTFINDWATMTCNPDVELSPEFNLASMFPRGDLPTITEAVLKETKCLSKRYVIDTSKIAALKAMIADKVENPTRVEVVTALIYKCAISASRSNSESPNPTLFVQTVNLRNRMIPPLPENTMGNMASFFAVSTMEESEIELHGLVGQMKESMAHFCNTYVNKFRGEEWLLLIKEFLKESRKLFIGGNQVVYRCSSWCKFPLYEADFGWGKPIWVTIASCVLKNTVVMMDTRSGDGIEVFVNLEEQDMAVFESDAELLGFASFNPSALDSDLELP